MSCVEVEALERMLEGAADSAERQAIEAHLRECAACVALHGEIENLAAAERLASISHHEPPGGDRLPRIPGVTIEAPLSFGGQGASSSASVSRARRASRRV